MFRSFLTWTTSIERKPPPANFSGLRDVSILQVKRGSPFSIRGAVAAAIPRCSRIRQEPIARVTLVTGWSCTGTTGQESTATRSSPPGMARFAAGAWSPDARTNVVRFTRAPLRARSCVPQAGDELRHMTCSRRRAALHEHSEDDAMPPTRGRIESLVMRIQAAFLENPMLSLTLPAAQRRFGIDDVACAGVLGALVDARVLTERQGAYRRYLPRPAVRPAA